jgi:oxygen-dependent protoporphyrinogen oxidase
MKRVVILGAGVSGLSTAWHLSKNPHLQITLLEKSPRVVLFIDTVKKEDFLFERGPRGYSSKGK